MKLKLFVLLALMLIAVAPSFAQEPSPLNTLTFNGVTLSYPDSLAKRVSVMVYPGDPLDVPPPSEIFSWEPKYTQIDFYPDFLEENANYNYKFTLRVYRAADLVGYWNADEMAAIQAIVDEKPDLQTLEGATDEGAMETLPTPFSPGAALVLIGRANYLETDTWTGYTFLTYHTQSSSVFSGNGFVYNFMGVSKDGSAYIILQKELFTELFPSFSDADAFNAVMEAYLADTEAYFAESLKTLDEAAPDDFAPNLSDLEALISSITLE